jgi:hypothetical protein
LEKLGLRITSKSAKMFSQALRFERLSISLASSHVLARSKIWGIGAPVQLLNWTTQTGIAAFGRRTLHVGLE